MKITAAAVEEAAEEQPEVVQQQAPVAEPMRRNNAPNKMNERGVVRDTTILTVNVVVTADTADDPELTRDKTTEANKTNQPKDRRLALEKPELDIAHDHQASKCSISSELS
mmetsp:Transcript_1579/g.2742  ORF Transcript_1579/g.2742 Transcript_1579/m.2742 type:complete len:111 (-) Transcript_1579:27-359(-)